MCGNKEVWETSDCGGAWKQCVFLTRITGELDSWKVIKETHVMKEKHVPRQAEVMGKEGVFSQDGCTNKQDPEAKKKQAERVEKVDRGEGAGSISTSESPGLANPRAPGRRGWDGPGVSGTPPPSSR